jgi:hypothetical protein
MWLAICPVVPAPTQCDVMFADRMLWNLSELKQFSVRLAVSSVSVSVNVGLLEGNFDKADSC